MAYYLSKERNQDIVGSYRRYQEYLREHEKEFPSGAFSLATSEWYQDATDHRCPHDSWLEDLVISETRGCDSKNITSMRLRLLAAYHDGYIEFVYPKVMSYSIENSASSVDRVDWLYDEFRLAASGCVIHEIEWSGSRSDKSSRWIIEASDVKFRWSPLPSQK
jgi:hypothetical protein